MDNITPRKRGRPRKFTNYTYFGMKITPEQKQKIQELATYYEKPANQVIMSLVEDAHLYSSAQTFALLPAKKRSASLAKSIAFTSQFQEPIDDPEDIIE